jgi:hypothetical protein
MVHETSRTRARRRVRHAPAIYPPGLGATRRPLGPKAEAPKRTPAYVADAIDELTRTQPTHRKGTSMLTLTHDASVSQPVRALGVANTRRSAAAVLKTRLHRREITLREILEHPPEELERQMTWEVLLWTPGIGRTRLRALNVRAIREGHVNLAAPLGALTERQRNWLAGRLCQ